MKNEPALDKNYSKTCVTSKDSYQPVHTRSMARVLVYRSLDSPGAVEGTCDQRRLIKLRGYATSEDSYQRSLIVGFDMRWL